MRVELRILSVIPVIESLLARDEAQAIWKDSLPCKRTGIISYAQPPLFPFTFSNSPTRPLARS